MSIQIGAGTVTGSLGLAGMWDRIQPAVQRAVERGTAKAEETATQLAPVGTVSRPVYKTGPYAGASWTSRDPGRMKLSITSRVRWRRDKSACVGWVTAGSHDAFYARFMELGAPKAENFSPSPFLRPAMETIDLAGILAAEIMALGSAGSAGGMLAEVADDA